MTIIGVQTATVVLLAFFCSVFDLHQGFSLLLGGLSAWLPNIFFAWYFFARASKRSPREVVYSLYIGEMIKLLMSVVIAVALVMMLPVSVVPFLGGLGAACLSVMVAAPLVIKQQ